MSPLWQTRIGKRVLETAFRRRLNQILENENLNPPFTIPNERPVEYAFVFKTIARHYPKRILDVGTGITALPHLIANCGLRVTAIDNIRDYWPSGLVNRHFLVEDADIRKYADRDGYDMVVCISTLEHIVDFDIAVRAMVGLLRHGGLLVMSFPYNNPEFIANVYTLEGSDAPRDIPFGAHAFSAREVSRWTAEHDLTLVDAEYWRFYRHGPWGVGPRLAVPEQTAQDLPHQIACLAFKKRA